LAPTTSSEAVPPQPEPDEPPTGDIGYQQAQYTDTQTGELRPRTPQELKPDVRSRPSVCDPCVD